MRFRDEWPIHVVESEFPLSVVYFSRRRILSHALILTMIQGYKTRSVTIVIHTCTSIPNCS